MIAQGSFEVTLQPEPPFHNEEGVALGRITVQKTFAGPLEGTSTVYMLSARTQAPGSAGYVALELVQASLEGKAGSFVVLHLATMHQGEQAMQLTISPNSGTGELAGIAGTMQIEIKEGQHLYTIDYSLP